MQTLQFKTNINCDGCIAKATPVLSNEQNIQEWSVNTNIPSKMLTVTTNLGPEEVIDIVKKAGFKAEKL
jgi:copper chaperone